MELNKTKNSNENLYKQVNNINKEKKLREEKNKIKKRAQSIIIISIILIIIGLGNFYSAILRFNDIIILNKMKKHLIITSVALLAFFIISKIKYVKHLSSKKTRIILLFLGVIIFLAVAFLPFPTYFPKINGGKGWIRYKFLSLQVTELFKIAYIVIIASIFSQGKDDNFERKYIQNFYSSILYTFIFFTLLLCLKDLGTGIHYIIITIFIIFMTDIKDKVIWFTSTVLFSMIALFSFLFYKFGETFGGYKYHRLKIFIDGLLENKYDRLEAFQIYQSLVGFGTGGLLGKGYGNGIQKYNYIPEVETDFAISTFGEEMGLLGMFLILFTFFTLFILIINVAENSKTYFEKYLVIGIAGYLITQVIVNIGVAIGLIPVLGIPLPFISSGGSSLLTLCIALGIVININNSKLKEMN